MNLSIFAGSANLPLAESVAAHFGTTPGRRILTRFPDTELHVEVQDSVRGHDVYLVQPTGPPVSEHLFDLIFLADACRRAGAARLTAVMPYFGYARQDRRAGGRESVGARLVADVIQAGAIERVVAVDLHNGALEGFFATPLEHLSAVPMLAAAIRPMVATDSVVVAPDLGAVKLARRYAGILGLPMAIVHKTRISAERVEAREIVGDVRGRAPIIVDDMISTGATIEAACHALLAAGCAPGVVVSSTHGLFVGPAIERLRALHVRSFVVTDSLARRASALPIETVTVAPLLADAIERLHDDRSLSDLIVHE